MPIYNTWNVFRTKKEAIFVNSLEEFINKGMSRSIEINGWKLMSVFGVDLLVDN